MFGFASSRQSWVRVYKVKIASYLALKKGCCLPVTARPEMFLKLKPEPDPQSRPDLQLCANGRVCILSMFEIQTRPFAIEKRPATNAIDRAAVLQRCVHSQDCCTTLYGLRMSVFSDHEIVARLVANNLATLYERCTIIIRFPFRTSKYFQARRTVKEDRWLFGAMEHVPLWNF